MVNQRRYPSEVIQEKESTCSKWDNLDHIKIDDWESLASCKLSNMDQPCKIFAKNFNFNIPKDAKIKSIFITHDYHKESDEGIIIIEPPTIKIFAGDEQLEQVSHVAADNYPVERILTFVDLDLSSNNVNNENFKVEVIFPKNESNNSGTLFFDFINVKVDYEVPKYLMSCGESNSFFPNKDAPLDKAVGDKFSYGVYFRNFNGLSKEKQTVKIILPEGLEIEKYYFNSSKTNTLIDDEPEENFKDIFDEENMLWYPSVRGKGISRIKLLLRCKTPGLKVLKAFNKHTKFSSDFYVNIHPEGYESKITDFEKTTKKWNSELLDNEDYALLNKELAIEVKDVSMEYEMAQEKIDNLKEYAIKWVKREIKPKTHFKALDNISFTVNKGERVGIIGFNGAGKSTLLKVLSGVLKPTKGSTHSNGKVAPLLELGAGFDHNYSGRENIFLNGAILGYSKEFLESKYDEIVEFSELGDFIELPIKNYSSGMNAKLGFSVATIVEPDILILDEILSVGDVKFQKKSGDKLKSMMGSGTTVLLVSHSTAKIRELCNRAIWLDKGELVMDGDVEYVCDAYIEAAKKASDDEIKDLELE